MGVDYNWIIARDYSGLEWSTMNDNGEMWIIPTVYS
jgi:hypothetical protein